MRRVRLVLIVCVLSVSTLAPAASALPEAPQGHPPASLILAQQRDTSSSSTRIPRGAAKLIVGGIVLAVGAVGWVVKKLRGDE